MFFKTDFFFQKTLGQFLSIFERAVARKRVPPRVIYQDDTGLSALRFCLRRVNDSLGK